MPGYSVVRVEVEGMRELPVYIWKEDWEGMMRRTGSKPEYGEYAAEFSPLGPGHYMVEPEGLGLWADVELTGLEVVWIEFRRKSVPSNPHKVEPLTDEARAALLAPPQPAPPPADAPVVDDAAVTGFADEEPAETDDASDDSADESADEPATTGGWPRSLASDFSVELSLPTLRLPDDEDDEDEDEDDGGDEDDAVAEDFAAEEDDAAADEPTFDREEDLPPGVEFTPDPAAADTAETADTVDTPEADARRGRAGQRAALPVDPGAGDGPRGPVRAAGLYGDGPTAGGEFGGGSARGQRGAVAPRRGRRDDGRVGSDVGCPWLHLRKSEPKIGKVLAERRGFDL